MVSSGVVVSGRVSVTNGRADIDVGVEFRLGVRLSDLTEPLVLSSSMTCANRSNRYLDVELLYEMSI